MSIFLSRKFYKDISFLETNRPIKTETEIRSPYHLIVINPKFKKVSPGDCIKA